MASHPGFSARTVQRCAALNQQWQMKKMRNLNEGRIQCAEKRFVATPGGLQNADGTYEGTCEETWTDLGRTPPQVETGVDTVGPSTGQPFTATHFRCDKNMRSPTEGFYVPKKKCYRPSEQQCSAIRSDNMRNVNVEYGQRYRRRGIYISILLGVVGLIVGSILLGMGAYRRRKFRNEDPETYDEGTRLLWAGAIVLLVMIALASIVYISQNRYYWNAKAVPNVKVHSVSESFADDQHFFKNPQYYNQNVVNRMCFPPIHPETGKIDLTSQLQFDKCIDQFDDGIS